MNEKSLKTLYIARLYHTSTQWPMAPLVPDERYAASAGDKFYILLKNSLFWDQCCRHLQNDWCQGKSRKIICLVTLSSSETWCFVVKYFGLDCEDRLFCKFVKLGIMLCQSTSSWKSIIWWKNAYVNTFLWLSFLKLFEQEIWKAKLCPKF